MGNNKDNNSGTGGDRIITKRAISLLEENNINPKDIPGNGSISYVNVLEYLRSHANENGIDDFPVCNEKEINEQSIIITGDPNLVIIAASLLIIKI